MRSICRLLAVGLCCVFLSVGRLWSQATEQEVVPSPAVESPSSEDPSLAIPGFEKPNLEGIEPAARRQIEGRQAALESLLSDPSSAPEARGRALGELGRLYHAYRLHEVALSLYVAAQALEPSEASWPYLEGVLAQESGDLVRAAAALERSFALDSTYAPASLRLGEIALLQGQPEVAAHWFEGAAVLGGAYEAAARFGLGRAAAARGLVNEAIEHFRAVLAAQPSAGRVRYSLALTLRSLGKLDEARAELAKPGSGEVAAPDPRITSLLSEAQGAGVRAREGAEALMAGRLADAEAAYRKAVKADPTFPEARRNLAVVLARRGKHREAATLLAEGLSLDPNDLWLRFDRGNALLAMGDVAGAIAELRRAVEIEPSFVSARFNLANALIRLERWPEAVAELERVLAAEPEHANARYLLAVGLVRAGKPKEGEQRLSALLADDPDHAEAHLALAQLQMSQRRFREAAPHFEAAVGLPDQGTMAAVAAAVSWSQAGEHAKAAKRLEGALKRHPDDATTKTALIRLLATCPDASIRDGQRALRMAEALYREKANVTSAELVGQALAASGALARAVEWQRSLLARVEEAGNASLAARLRQDLATYEQGQPVLRALE